MTITHPVRQSKGQPIGGEFAPHDRSDSDIALHILPADSLHPMSEDEAQAFVEHAFAEIDAEWTDADAAAELDADDIVGAAANEAVSDGRQAALSEVIAYVLSNNEQDYDYAAQGKRILGDRREGFVLETTDGWTGPGELSAIKRQSAAEHFNARANASFVAATAPDAAPSAAGRHFGAFDVFEQAAHDLTGPNDFYTGE